MARVRVRALALMHAWRALGPLIAHDEHLALEHLPWSGLGLELGLRLGLGLGPTLNPNPNPHLRGWPRTPGQGKG